MDFVNNAAEYYFSDSAIRRYMVPLLGCIIGYMVFRKTREFEWHALQNTAASLILFWSNLVLLFLFYDDIAGLLQQSYRALHIPMLHADTWDETPLIIVCLMGIVINDFIYYWTHRVMHSRWGWPTHAAHHSDTHVNAFTTYRVHFLEWLLVTTSYFFLLTWLQMPEAIPAVALFTSLHGMYVHMDLPFTHGPLKNLIASPVFHRWHHADVEDAYGKNLSNIMPLWDVLFGTYYSFDPVPHDVEMGAQKTGVADKNPVQIFFYPVFEWKRLIAENRQPETNSVLVSKDRRCSTPASETP